MLPKDRVSLGFIKTFTPALVTTLRRGYSISNLRADALAGLTVAIVGVPLAMALAVASGAKPETGLFSAVVGGFVISALGGSRFQIGGPASAFVVLVAKTIEIHGFQGLLAATIMAGLILLLLGYMRFGTYIKYIPHSVPVGFTAGIAVILFASQMKELLGLRIAHEPVAFLPKLEATWAALDTMRLSAILMAAASLTFILYQRKQRPRFPGMMTTIAAAAFLTWLLNLPVDTIGTRFGEISSVLPRPSWPNVTLTMLFELVPTAIAIAILGAMESLLSAVVADSMTGRHHNSNCELVAQGYANITSALFGGLCCSGALTRTATNVRAGAWGPVGGIFASFFLLGAMSIAAPLASHIPLATLAAVLTIVAWDMVDRKAIISIFKRDRNESLVLSATFLLTVFRDVTEGIAVGVSFGSLLFMHRMTEFVEAQMNVSFSGCHDEHDDANDHHRHSVDKNDDVVIYRINGPFFFSASRRRLWPCSTRSTPSPAPSFSI